MRLNLNPTLTRLRASPTLAINEQIRELLAAGEDIIHFGFGQSPFPVCPRIADEVARHAGDKNYLPAQGLRALREVVAEYFEPLLGNPISPDLVFVGPGSKTNIFHVLYAHAGPLVLAQPSWVSYGPQAQLLGKPTMLLPARREQHYKVSAEDLDEQLTLFGAGHQALLLLNSPNNPTGAVYGDSELEALAEVCRRHQAMVLSDEIYGQVTYDGSYRSIARFYPEGTLVSTGLSKAHSAGGYRLGVLIVPPTLAGLRAPLANLATETFSCVTSAVQHGAVLAWSGDPEVEAHVRDCTAIHTAVGRYVARELAAGGVRVDEPQGAFYLFPDFEDFRTHAGLKGSEDLADRLLRDQRVATLPGTAFFLPEEHLAVRISPVDYDGSRALEVFRDLPDGAADGHDGFIEEACPRVVEGVRRLAGLGGEGPV